LCAIVAKPFLRGWRHIFLEQPQDKGTNLMEVKLYVGNLSFSTTEDELRSLFAQAGTVQSADIIKDR
jgi:RNA recognition motif-containing protein